ncbi:pilus assembly FimT family protein [Crassaminicella profunda]|uniref:pilus assembly FimT family protein n=1 Tax=Crassaminicella profunda TaxID=1286698 RepID=UPI001CA775A5|nr:prepilin-type N-terminal cleavage/methylation domain-containing protein [Crassaminicella profunda]QZY56975.1 prepilin-type N-terminal cleavage/methylation domain-containing protein [Crassaminicella profunda]
MKIRIGKNGFTLIEILITVVLLEIIAITTTTILFQLNKINIKTSKTYEINQVAHSYMEEIKCNHLTIDDKNYSIEELQNKEINFFKDQYQIILTVSNDSYNGLYNVILQIKDKNNNICILESYINFLEETCYDELSIEEKDLNQ